MSSPRSPFSGISSLLQTPFNTFSTPPTTISPSLTTPDWITTSRSPSPSTCDLADGTDEMSVSDQESAPQQRSSSFEDEGTESILDVTDREAARVLTRMALGRRDEQRAMGSDATNFGSKGGNRKRRISSGVLEDTTWGSGTNTKRRKLTVDTDSGKLENTTRFVTAILMVEAALDDLENWEPEEF